MWTRILVIALTSVTVAGLSATQSESKEKPSARRESTIATVRAIQKADYEGNRAGLKWLHDQLIPPANNKKLASGVLYWRGFALWRRAINGFNETPTPTDLQEDLNNAVADFRESIVNDPANVEAKIGEASCLGYLMFVNRKDQSHVQELAQQAMPLLKEAQVSAPDNPRLLWVMGPIRWSSPPERGGGQDKAFDLYNRGLEIIRRQPKATADPLEPSWGEPELLMNLSWSYLNRKSPDLDLAQQNADAALKIVPYWHYVKDILVPQIQAAKRNTKT